MSLAWILSSDPRPVPAPLAGFRAAECRDAALLARLMGRTSAEVRERFAAGHRAFVGRLDGTPAAFGWLATRTASLGELGVTLHLGRAERYLWNFVTLPAYRGRGVYPRLLEAILRVAFREGAGRAWIAYAPENHASAAGIRKAGFTHVANLSFDATGGVAFRERAAGAGAAVAALLGVPATYDALSACWRCARAASPRRACAADACGCDYQRPESGCSSAAAAAPPRASGQSSSNGAGIS